MKQEFLDKAKENMVVAEWCFNQKYFNACVNRIYYSMYQAALAALIYYHLTSSDEEHSHRWVQSRFAAELVSKRKIFPGYHSHLMRVQERRNIADYRKNSISKKQAERTLSYAKDFIETVMEEIHES